LGSMVANGIGYCSGGPEMPALFSNPESN
jgi:hypothetical protein